MNDEIITLLTAIYADYVQACRVAQTDALSRPMPEAMQYDIRASELQKRIYEIDHLLTKLLEKCPEQQ
jgi:hypothetical protein